MIEMMEASPNKPPVTKPNTYLDLDEILAMDFGVDYSPEGLPIQRLSADPRGIAKPGNLLTNQKAAMFKVLGAEGFDLTVDLTVEKPSLKPQSKPQLFPDRPAPIELKSLSSEEIKQLWANVPTASVTARPAVTPPPVQPSFRDRRHQHRAERRAFRPGLLERVSNSRGVKRAIGVVAMAGLALVGGMTVNQTAPGGTEPLHQQPAAVTRYLETPASQPQQFANQQEAAAFGSFVTGISIIRQSHPNASPAELDQLVDNTLNLAAQQQAR